MYICSYWLNWLVLRDVFNTACHITIAVYKRVGKVEGLGEWVNTAKSYSQLAVRPAGQTDGNSTP